MEKYILIVFLLVSLLVLYGFTVWFKKGYKGDIPKLPDTIPTDGPNQDPNIE